MTTVNIQLSSKAILELIQIASHLGEVIDEQVNASDDSEVKAAWNDARSMFTKGFDAAYGHPAKS